MDFATKHALNQRLTKAILDTAFWEGLEDVIKALDEGADPNFQNEAGETPLMLAAEGDNYDLVTELLNRGADPNIRNHKGMTAYDFAKHYREKVNTQPRIIIALLAPNPAILDPETEISNLAIVASGNDYELLEAMTDRIEIVDQRDREGNTPLIYAIVNGKLDNVRLLLDRGADPNLANNGGGTPLAYATQLNREAIRDLLIEMGAVIR
jgi:hypothetical protein